MCMHSNQESVRDLRRSYRFIDFLSLRGDILSSARISGSSQMFKRTKWSNDLV